LVWLVQEDLLYAIPDLRRLKIRNMVLTARSPGSRRREPKSISRINETAV
jgi:hypothetical protein